MGATAVQAQVGNITVSGGAIQFSNGSAFASDAANLFWDDTNKRLGIGTNVPTSKLTITDGASSINFGSDGGGAFIRPSGNMSIYSANSSQFAFITNSGVGINVNPTARFHIKGSGSTSATTSLLVQNSAGTTALQITDNGNMSILYNRITDGTNNDKSLYFLPDNTAVLSNYGKISLRVNDGLGWNSGLEVVEHHKTFYLIQVVFHLLPTFYKTMVLHYLAHGAFYAAINRNSITTRINSLTTYR